MTSFQTSGRPSTGGGLSDSQPWAPTAAAASAHLMKEEQVGESGMNMAQLYVAASGKSLYHVGPQSLTLPSKSHSLNLTQFPSSLRHTWGGGAGLQQSSPLCSINKGLLQARSKVMAKHGPEMGCPGPPCHSSSLGTPFVCLPLDVDSSCSLGMTGD